MPKRPKGLKAYAKKRAATTLEQPKYPASTPTARQKAERIKYRDFFDDLAMKYERMRRRSGGSDA